MSRARTGPAGTLDEPPDPDPRVPGVVLGAALCCLPGATLGAVYDDRRASKEAAMLREEGYRREAEAQARRRRESTVLKTGLLTEQNASGRERIAGSTAAAWRVPLY